MRLRSLFLAAALCQLACATRTWAVSFGRCDVSLPSLSSVSALVPFGTDDAGRPVILVLSSTALTRLVVDPVSLRSACTLGVSRSSLPLGTFAAQDLAVGDIDGDRLLDAVLAGGDGVSGHDLLVYQGTGNGEISVHPSAPFRAAVDGTVAVAIGDVDRDGSVDLVSGSGADSSVTILYSGTTKSSAIAVRGVSPATLGVAPLDDNATPDILVGSTGSGLTALFQGAARVFTRSDGAASSVGGPMRLSDLDSDGTYEVLLTRASSDRLELYLAPLPANLAMLPAPTSFATGDEPGALATGDFTGDGDIDVVVANRAANTVSLFVGNGFGGLVGDATQAGCRAQASSATCSVIPRPAALAAGDAQGNGLDLDGDGVGDILVSDETGNLTFLLSSPASANPTPTVTATAVTPSPTPTVTATASATPDQRCCVAHDGKGCEQDACSQCVCANDGRCCDTTWDDICVGFAVSNLCADKCTCSSFTPTPSPTPSESPTITPTFSPSLPPTHTPSLTPTNSPTPTRPGSPAPATRTPTQSPTNTGTPPTVTRTPSRTSVPSSTPTKTLTPTFRECSGGLCVNGEGCSLDAAEGGASLWLWSLLMAVFALVRRSRSLGLGS